MKHMCEKKRRYMSRHDRDIVLAFAIFQRYYRLNHPTMKERTFEHFMNSQYYTAFVRFARHTIDLNIIHPMVFVDFIVQSGVAVDKWCQNGVYETFIREIAKRESAEAAFERTILLMQQWSNDTGHDWTEFFRQIEPTLATFWIKNGRLSPWVLYSADSSESLLTRMSPEQLQIVEAAIDPDFWGKKLMASKDDVAFIRDELKRYGV